MEIAKTVCFSGYRPEKFPFLLVMDYEPYLQLRDEARQSIRQAISDGFTTFLCGMSRGWDLICAELLMELRAMDYEYTGLKLVAVLPFAGHGFRDDWGALHSKTVAEADEVVTIAGKFHRDNYRRRNFYMVDNSRRVITYYNGQAGGTAQTLCSIDNFAESITR